LIYAGLLWPHLRISAAARRIALYHASGSAEGYELNLFHNISDTKDQMVRIESGQTTFTMVDCEKGIFVSLPLKRENGGNHGSVECISKDDRNDSRIFDSIGS
jgi:hypothetical protein